MAVHNQQILPPIVVIIQEPVSEAHKGYGRLSDTRLITHIREKAGAVVLEEDIVVVGKVGVDDREMSVVLVVAGGDAHIRNLAAEFVQRVSAFETLVLKRAVAFVDVQIVRRGVVGHQKVRLAVPVHVGKQSAQPVIAIGVVHAQLLADVGKGSIAVVVKQVVMLAFQSARPAHHLHAAILAKGEVDRLRPRDRRIVQIDLRIAIYEQVQATIAIVIAEGRAR